MRTLFVSIRLKVENWNVVPGVRVAIEPIICSGRFGQCKDLLSICGRVIDDDCRRLPDLRGAGNEVIEYSDAERREICHAAVS